MAMDDRFRIAKGWMAVFVDRPDVLAALVADLLKQAYAIPGRIGQRPMPYESDVDLLRLIYGDYTEEPFHLALPPLLDMTVTSLSYMSGVPELALFAALHQTKDPRHVRLSMDELEAVAECVGKQASYFVEWRVQAVAAALTELMHARPGLATDLLRNHIRFEQRP